MKLSDIVGFIFPESVAEDEPLRCDQIHDFPPLKQIANARSDGSVCDIELISTFNETGSNINATELTQAEYLLLARLVDYSSTYYISEICEQTCGLCSKLP